jgi:2-keto-4-pentenoate hydratase/2-oxohepta-3-ene-1,7-dioic acid hydratase in catechol pathway
MEKLIRFSAGGRISYGILDGETAYETASLFLRDRGAAHPLASIQILHPATPSKIVCVGRNYVDHAKELGNEVPTEPLIFLKPPSSLVGPGDAIVYPKISQNLHHEAELGVVIGKRARHVKAADAWDAVFGFTCVNDVTARDLQRKDGQWTRGKGCDTFCPNGPWIVRKEDVDFTSLRVKAILDGVVKQDASVNDMIFPVPVIIEFVTQFLTLEPGDLIATGTPAGVGPMQVGSTITIEIPGIGTLSNPIAAE